MVNARLALVAGMLSLGPACGWFAGSDSGTTLTAGDTDATKSAAPTCRPKELDARGTPPWKVGDVTPGGWKVTAVDTSNVEYVRVTFEKDATKSVLEIAYNEAGPGDWSTDAYRLMPAPDETPPQELLDEAMAQLKAHAAAETGPPFVIKGSGIDDAYTGLPPCP